MIRLSAALVAVAIGILIGGIATSKLGLVYIAILVSAVSLLALAVGVLLKRAELFGAGPGLVPAGAGPGPVPSASRAGGRDQVPPLVAENDPWEAASAGNRSPVSGAAAGYGAAFEGTSPVTAGAGAGRPAGPVSPWEQDPGREWSAPAQASAASTTAASTTADRTGSAATAAAAPTSGSAPPPAPPATPSPPATPAEPAASSQSGSAPRSWFDRLGDPATGSAAATSGTTGTGSGWAWTAAPWDTPEPADASAPASAVVPGDSDPALAGDDNDDDWPTRYSWLDDETDEAAVPVGESSPEPGAAVGQPGVADSAASRAVGETVSVDEQAEGGTDGDIPAPAARATVTGTATPVETAEADTDITAEPEPQPQPAAEPDPDPAAEPEPDADAGESGKPRAELEDDAVDKPRAELEDDAVDKPRAELEDDAVDEPSAEAGGAPGATGESDGGDPETGEAHTAESGLVSVLSGVPRYHQRDCVLIRFMPEADVQQLPVLEAEAAGCTPCTACQPVG